MTQHIKNSNYPLESNEDSFQGEMAVPRDSKVIQGGQRPTIDFTHNPSNATVGTASPTNKPTRKQYDEVHENAEANLSEQFKKPEAFDSPAAFK